MTRLPGCTYFIYSRWMLAQAPRRSSLRRKQPAGTRFLTVRRTSPEPKKRFSGSASLSPTLLLGASPSRWRCRTVHLSLQRRPLRHQVGVRRFLLAAGLKLCRRRRHLGTLHALHRGNHLSADRAQVRRSRRFRGGGAKSATRARSRTSASSTATATTTSPAASASSRSRLGRRDLLHLLDQRVVRGRLRLRLQLIGQRPSLFVCARGVPRVVFHLRRERENPLHFGRDLDARVHLDRDRLALALPVHRQSHGVRAGGYPRRVHAGVRSMRDRATAATTSASATASRADRIVVHVPRETVHAGGRFQPLRRRRPIQWRTAIGGWERTRL